ncbi:hypothetical protein ACFL1E_01790 [Candidatus Omnitrophota bacterium]
MGASKVLIIVLGAILVVMLIFSLQTYSSKQSLMGQYQSLKQSVQGQRDELEARINGLQQEKVKLQDSVGRIQKQLDGIATERNEWKNKYEVVSREKEDLIKKIKTMPTTVTPQPVAPTAAPVVSGEPQPGEDAYWAKLIRDKKALELKLQELKSELNQQLVRFGEVKRSHAEVELELGKVQQEKNELERKLRFSKQVSKNISLELVTEKNDKKLMKDEYSRMKADNSSLRRNVKELASSKQSLEKGLNELEEQKIKLQKRIADTEGLVRSRLNDLLRLKDEVDMIYDGREEGEGEYSSVELPPIVVRAQHGTAGPTSPATATQLKPPKELSGKIISINKDNNFAIVDLGEEEGVMMGRIFKVYRGEASVGTLEVIQTRRDISAADIKDGVEKIQVGDLVR